MSRQRWWRGDWKLPVAEIGSTKRTIARCGAGRAWPGWEASGKIETPRANCWGGGPPTTPPPHDRWHIERWLPPESYGSPRDWYARTIERADGLSTPALGPYPERGEYEHCFTLQGPHGEFVQLTSTVAEYIARAIETGRGVSPAERRKAIDERERRSDREYDAWAWDVLDSGCPAFHGLPFVACG
jgi:hypothetical protein